MFYLLNLLHHPSITESTVHSVLPEAKSVMRPPFLNEGEFHVVSTACYENCFTCTFNLFQWSSNHSQTECPGQLIQFCCIPFSSAEWHLCVNSTKMGKIKVHLVFLSEEKMTFMTADDSMVPLVIEGKSSQTPVIYMHLPGYSLPLQGEGGRQTLSQGDQGLN